MLEATVALFPALDALLERVLAGPLFRADELPTPTEAEREAPKRDGGQKRVAQLELGT